MTGQRLLHALNCWLGRHEWQYGRALNKHGERVTSRYCAHCPVRFLHSGDTTPPFDHWRRIQ